MVIRAHRLGDLMTQGRGKDEFLGETAKTYIRELWLHDNYGRKKVISSKEMNKGLECEEQAITLYTQKTGNFFAKNHKKYFEFNDRLRGTPDMVKDGVVVDIKTSWDIFTFAKAQLTPTYLWQLRAYMWLTGAERAELAYCLVDTPPMLVSDEIRKLWYNYGQDDNNPEYIMKAEQIEKNHKFEDIPVGNRVKVFHVLAMEDFEEVFTEQYNEGLKFYNSLSL